MRILSEKAEGEQAGVSRFQQRLMSIQWGPCWVSLLLSMLASLIFIRMLLREPNTLVWSGLLINQLFLPLHLSKGWNWVRRSYELDTALAARRKMRGLGVKKLRQPLYFWEGRVCSSPEGERLALIVQKLEPLPREGFLIRRYRIAPAQDEWVSELVDGPAGLETQARSLETQYLHPQDPEHPELDDFLTREDEELIQRVQDWTNQLNQRVSRDPVSPHLDSADPLQRQLARAHALREALNR